MSAENMKKDSLRTRVLEIFGSLDVFNQRNNTDRSSSSPTDKECNSRKRVRSGTEETFAGKRIKTSISPDSGNGSNDESVRCEEENEFPCQWRSSRLQQPKMLPVPNSRMKKAPTKLQLYQYLARQHRSRVEKCNNRVSRMFDWVLSSLFFALELSEFHKMKKTESSKNHAERMFRSIGEQLSIALEELTRATKNPVVMHMMPRVKIVSLTLLAIVHHHLYELRSEELSDLNGFLSSEACAAAVVENPNESKSNESTVQMPLAIFELMKKQTEISVDLFTAEMHWSEARKMSKSVENEFWKYIEYICDTTIEIDSSFEELGPVILTAVSSLEKELEAESRSEFEASTEINEGIRSRMSILFL